MKPEPQKRICGDCIHEYACSAWNHGNMHNTDARNCANYETVKTSSAYYIGVQDGKKLAKAEVVRCVDCDVPHNRRTGCPNLNGMIPPPDFYCARGERKQQTDVDTDIYVGNKSECNVCSRITEANKDIFWTFARTHQPQNKEEYHRVPVRFCPACGRAFK